jgi:hypothetical protein
VAVALVATSSCTAGVHHAAATTGHVPPGLAVRTPTTLGSVRGNIWQVGGPLGYHPYNGGGVVFVWQGTRYIGHVSTSAGHPFRLTLPAGVYELRGGSRSSPHCAQPVTVVVRVAKPTPATLRCEIR